MKIALFAAVEEEVSKIKEHVHLTGIGRENTIKALLNFVDKHRGEQFTILNLGTAGAHSIPVGTILNIKEIVSGGTAFLNHPMTMHNLDIEEDTAQKAVLYSSDCFVSPRVFSKNYLEELSTRADCFDMESAATYAIAQHYKIPFVSYKIVSDNLDVELEEWQRRVSNLSGVLCDYVTSMLDFLSKKDKIELI